MVKTVCYELLCYYLHHSIGVEWCICYHSCMYVTKCHQKQTAGLRSNNFCTYAHLYLCQFSSKSSIFLTFIFKIKDFNQVRFEGSYMIILQTMSNKMVDSQAGRLVVRQTGRLVDRQTGMLVKRQTGTLVDRQTVRLVDRQTGRLVDRKTGRLVY